MRVTGLDRYPDLDLASELCGHRWRAVEQVGRVGTGGAADHVVGEELRADPDRPLVDLGEPLLLDAVAAVGEPVLGERDPATHRDRRR